MSNIHTTEQFLDSCLNLTAAKECQLEPKGYGHLELTRKKTEQIIIDKNIILTVLQTNDRIVKFRISAPRHVIIDRREIFLGKVEESNE